MPFKGIFSSKPKEPKPEKAKDEDSKKMSTKGARSGPLAAGPPSPGEAGAVMGKYTRKRRQFPRIDQHLDIFYREQGTVMDRIAAARRPQEEVKEVRTGAQAVNTKDFKAGLESSGDIREKLAMCILYGTEFRLKQLCFIARREDELEAWAEAILYHSLEHNPQYYEFPRALSRWIEKHWAGLDRQGKQSIVSKDIRLFLQRVNYKMSPKDIKDYFAMVDKLKQNAIGIEEFTELYHILVDIKDLSDEFCKFASAKCVFVITELLQFLRVTQNDTTATAEDAARIIKAYSKDGSFKISGFIEYLHSRENDIWNHRHDDIVQDMTQPLAHYYIASSHNTYLMGDQFRSESSVEAYARALREGCRCIEIDCWDGPNTDPIVYHGHTMTSKIKFRDVLNAIRDHAFVTSEFPVILSIENHCSLPQQEVMAQLFQQTFGNMLITEPLMQGATQYPSPLDLLKRIIIKHKKLDAGATEIVTAHREDISSSLKNGFLMLEDRIDHSWSRHYFVLTETKLSYMEAQEEEPETQEDTAVGDDEKAQQSELHYGEPWFHGDLRPGAQDPVEAREYAAQLVMANAKGDGTFLVRESRTHGGYALSFLYEGKVQHCRIRSANGRYFLTNEATFPNLFELVEYFKREPLRTVGYSMRLAEPVPQPAPHEDKKWFHRKLSRSQAEDWLKRIKSDGAFLVRESETDPQNFFAISFKAEGKVKHCRIKKEGRMYCIGDAEFESLVKLVEYYEKHPLYRKMKLRYPVDEELLRQNEAEEIEEDIYHCEELYQEPNAFDKGKQKPAGLTTTCKAVYAYTAKSPDELSFPKDAIITNVVKKDVELGWWQGDYGGMVSGWLPCNYVEELKFDNIGKEEREGDDNPLGLLQKAEMNVANLEVKPRPSTKDMRFVFRIQNTQDAKSSIEVGVDSEEEMRSWVNAITRATELLGKANTKDMELQKKFGISKELSDLIFYSQSVSFPGFDRPAPPREYNKMSSFMEKKMEQMCRQQAKEFNEYHYRQISRVYPSGRRVDSSNFDPQPMWNAGCQMAALNYQHYDRPLWLNHGKFLQNGRCGYVLKPEIQRRAPPNTFDPFNIAPLKLDQMTLNIRIISARHLVKSTRGIASPFVEVEVVGLEEDNNKYKTRTVQDNGLCPVWNEDLSFTLACPEMASLRFVVQDEDMFGDPNTIGQACYPIGAPSEPNLRTGYRAIPLRNEYNDPLELSSLLVHIEINVQPPTDEYQSLQELRAEIRRHHQRRDELVKEMALAGGTLDVLTRQTRSEELKQVKTTVLEMEKKTQLMTLPAPKKDTAKAKPGGKMTKK